MRKLVVAGATAAVLCGGLLSSCRSQPHEVSPSTAAARTSDSQAAQDAVALKSLHAWLARPLPGTLTVSGVDTDLTAKTVVSRRLSGTFDLAAGTASLTGTRTTLTASAAQEVSLSAVEADGLVYTSIATDQAVLYPGHKWLAEDLAGARAAGTAHSLWWAALNALDAVHVVGPSEVDGKTAVEYSGTVDLAKSPGTAAPANSQIFRKAGTTKVSIDLYTDLGTGNLVGLTYRLGLKVSVDAVATTTSTAGYQVDLTNFGGPTPTASPLAVPSARLATHGGNGELSSLLLF